MKKMLTLLFAFTPLLAFSQIETQTVKSVLAPGYDLWFWNGLAPEGGTLLSSKGIADLNFITVQATATGTGGFLYRRPDWTVKWGANVPVNTASVLSSYNGADGSVSITNGKYYTFNVPANPAYDGSNPIAILETSGMPVSLNSVTQDIPSPTSVDAVTISVALSGAKSAEENIFVRYTTDSWSSSSIMLASVTGLNADAIIPVQAEGTTVNYYALSSTVAAVSLAANPDLLTLNYNTNGGSNFTYVVGPPVNPTSGTVTDASYTDPTTLDGDLTVTGTLTIGATVNTGSNGIDLGTTGSISGETPTTYIVGTVQGLADINAAPVTNFGGLGLSIDPAAFNLGNTTIVRESGAGAGLGSGINQSWTITPTNQPAGNPVDVDLSWPAANDNGIDLGNLFVLKSNDGGLTWIVVPGAVFNTGTDPRTVSFTVTSFSDFTIGDGDTPLPIELISWTATPGDNKVILNWETTSELNHDGFEIYRSTTTDGKFTRILNYKDYHEYGTKGQQGGKYSYVDNRKVYNGLSYFYKLVDVSVDGKRMDHRVISAIPTDGKPDLPGYEIPAKFEILSLYPNPFNPSGKLEFSLPQKGFVSIELYNVIGQKVATAFEGTLEGGNDHMNRIEISGNGLPSGIYLVVVNYSGQRLTSKFTLLK